VHVNNEAATDDGVKEQATVLGQLVSVTHFINETFICIAPKNEV
jgi:hypothetical protein